MTDAKKRCFVVARIGGKESKERRKIDGLLASVLRPVLEPMGFEIEAAHEIDDSGSITTQVVQRLLESELVVADLSGLNPNVMYELAVRHCKRLPVVTLAEESTSLPFDIVSERTLFYEPDHLGVAELKKQLPAAVNQALSTNQPDNPVYRGIAASVLSSVSGEESQALILTRLSGIEAALHRLTGGEPAPRRQQTSPEVDFAVRRRLAFEGKCAFLIEVKNCRDEPISLGNWGVALQLRGEEYEMRPILLTSDATFEQPPSLSVTVRAEEQIEHRGIAIPFGESRTGWLVADLGRHLNAEMVTDLEALFHFSGGGRRFWSGEPSRDPSETGFLGPSVEPPLRFKRFRWEAEQKSQA